APGTAIIFCYVLRFVSLPPFRRKFMNLNRSLGLTIVAAALVTAYGCSKEEPKKVETPATAAAPAMPELTVKIGHVGPTTGPQAHLGKDNENGARLAIDDANAKKIVI